MKTYAVVLILLLCPFFTTYGNIYNGYTKDKDDLKKGLDTLETQLEKSTNEKTSKQLDRKLKKLRNQYEAVCANYDATENLLDDIKRIDATLYQKVSSIANAEGTLTHVFVKIMAKNTDKFIVHSNNGFSLSGYTNIAYWAENPNVHASEYGLYSVSVVVGNTPDKLTALAHEFGHVLYQVKNLKSYTTYYNQQYNLNSISKFGLGHHPLDPGNAFVKSVENNFKRKFKQFLQSMEDAPVAAELIPQESVD